MKIKQWDVSVLGNKPAQQKENMDFYTSDTDAHLRVKLTDVDLQPTTATFTIVNRRDGSLVSEVVDMEGDTATYHMREEVIAHAGDWQLQVVFHTGKGYTTRVLNLHVGGYLLDNSAPRLEIIENWTTFTQSARDFLRDLEGDHDVWLERIENLEEIYAPKLTEVTAQLAETTYDVSELQGLVGYSDHDIVGIEADLQNRRVTRIAGAVNRTPGQSFDNIRAFGGRRRCTVANDGEVLGYYGESGYDETGATGQVMVEQPKFYYKVVPLKLEEIEDGKGYHMRKARYYVSDVPKKGFRIHPAFVDKNGKIRDFIYLSAFEGSIFDTSASVYLKNDEQIADFAADLMTSIPGAKPASGLTQSLTRANSRLLAQNRGDGWEQAYSATASLTQMLFAIEYASFNTQKALAYGVLGKPSGEGNESEVTGATTSLGNDSGFIKQNGFDVPTYRGEENFYGNIYKWVDGLNYQGAEGRRELYVATHGFADNIDTEPFKDIGFKLPGGSGYVSAFGYGNEDLDWLFVGSEYSGNSSVPVGDYNYSSGTGWTVAQLGGYWGSSANGGGFLWILYYSSGSSSRDVGCRLVYAPPVGGVE